MSHYFLRPRKLINYSDQLSDQSDHDDHEEENDLVITISQLKKKKVATDSNNTIHTFPSNSDLESVPFALHNFDDLYRLASMCVHQGKMYKDCQRLPLIFNILQEIHDLIGLDSVKNGLFRLILFELQNMPSYWRHMIITALPGLGKTTVANIIAKLMNRLGNGSSDEITIGNPLNMISGWEGQTPGYVESVVREALSKSKVLFIDEAPSLNDNRRGAMPDNYGQKCINMLMQMMDKHAHELIVILAGYRNEMERNILQANRGFRRRIQWFFNIEPYTADELYAIFLQKIQKAELKISSTSRFDVQWFRKHYHDFPFFGGSVENFVEKIKSEQYTRTFGQTNKHQVPDATIAKGFQLYLRYVIEPMKEEQRKVESENTTL